jgi:cbb3-type cytochrome oxidase maturation protein
MSVLYILVPLALVIVFAAIGAYVWAARKGQFDDTETPAIRMLHDDEDSAGSAPGGGNRGDVSKDPNPHRS